MNKFLALCLGLILCVSLTGCCGILSNVDINSDGSGVINVKVGFSEAAYDLLKTYGDPSQNVSFSEDQEMKPFLYNGKTYYGIEDTVSFLSIEEFNSIGEDAGDFSSEGFDIKGISLIQNEDNSLTLIFKTTSETTESSMEAETTLESLDMSEEDMKMMLEDMVMLYTFNMPGKVSQIEGDGAGIVIKDNVIEIDLLKLDVPKEPGIEKIYSFTTAPNVMTEFKSVFLDVPTSLWSCKAINVLAEGGLVSGVGEGNFSPERGMKISEFCQVLANATGLESGADETGYWAAKAIKSCIEKRYIYTHGEVHLENYSDIITREEAIAAMQLASGRTQLADKEIKLEDIPDNAEISEQYKELVLKAYNSGITAGINEQLKFSPKSELTRGQVCQLFYNVDWTRAINK